MRSISHLGLLATLALTAAAGCSAGAAAAGPSSGSAGAARPAVTVLTAPARAASVTRTATLTGTLFGDEEVSISTEAAGAVAAIHADLGDVVTGGALLAELDPVNARLAEEAARRALEATLARLGLPSLPGATFDAEGIALVIRARAERNNETTRLARLRDLRQKDPGFVTQQQLDDAATALSVAEASLEVARLEARGLVAEARQRAAQLDIALRGVEDCRIVAPPGPRRFEVARRQISVGEYVRDGTAAFRLVSADRLKMRAAVPERYAPALRPGLPVAVRVDAWPGRAFPGVISRKAPAVDAASRTFAIEVLIDNADGACRPGMFARATVATGVEEVVLVPLDAVVSFAGVTKVFVHEGGAARERLVEAGVRWGGDLEVRGIPAGAPVLVRGQTAVADGTPVQLAKE